MIPPTEFPMAKSCGQFTLCHLLLHGPIGSGAWPRSSLAWRLNVDPVGRKSDPSTFKPWSLQEAFGCLRIASSISRGLGPLVLLEFFSRSGHRTVLQMNMFGDILQMKSLGKSVSRFLAAALYASLSTTPSIHPIVLKRRFTKGQM